MAERSRARYLTDKPCQKQGRIVLYIHTVFILISVRQQLMQHSQLMASPEALHPSLWRASQLGQGATRCLDTGFAALSAQLPGGGWPSGSLIDLLVQQPGSGELRLLAPALAQLPGLPIVLLQPPHPPQALALAAQGLAPSQLLWLKSAGSKDALWAAENILRSGSCGALLFWQSHVRADSLRRRQHPVLHAAPLARRAGCIARAAAPVRAAGRRRHRDRLHQAPGTAARRAPVPAPATSFIIATPCDSGSACACPGFRSKYFARAGRLTSWAWCWSRSK